MWANKEIEINSGKIKVYCVVIKGQKITIPSWNNHHI